jgi:hypothetical protein
MMTAHGVALAFDQAPTQQISERIRGFDDIPDIMTMQIPPIEWLVDGLIARGTLTLWAGTDGTAKTFLAQKMAIAVAAGGAFLGRRCQRCPVLYLDFENPAFAVQERLNLMAGGPISGLRIWGTWVEQQPPQIGNELLLSIAKDTKPLIIVDPFLYAHGADENSSTEMASVMQCLRYCAAAGGAVIIIHHPAKTEGSTGRGSSAIRGACDVAFLQEMSDETGLITLACTKNRFGERHSVTIRPDYDDGSFAVTDSPQFTKRAADQETLRRLIEETPGLAQNAICKASGMKKSRCVEVLKTGRGSLWIEQQDGQFLRYFPPVPKAKNFTPLGNRFPRPEQPGTGEHQNIEKSEVKLFPKPGTGQEQVVPVPKFPPFIGGTGNNPASVGHAEASRCTAKSPGRWPAKRAPRPRIGRDGFDHH